MLNLQALKTFKETHPTRNLVFRSDSVEVLLVCWKPGQGSPVHDHGASDGLMIILEGEITNTAYAADGRKTTVTWSAGDVGHTPAGTRHEVKNASNGDVVSLHIYAPPLQQELQDADLGYDNV